MKKKYVQGDLFENINENELPYGEFIKNKIKPKVLHEKKFQGDLIKEIKKLGLVFIHLKNRCLNRFYHNCSKCGNKELITCHGYINKEYTGYPDILFVAGGIELKHRSYGVKTPKLRKGKQKDVCEILSHKIPIECINELTQKELMNFLKLILLRIRGEEI